MRVADAMIRNIVKERLRHMNGMTSKGMVRCQKNFNHDFTIPQKTWRHWLG
jgi:hypothetical protein